MTNDYVVAKYIRLSLDDSVTESLSIPHQHMILDAHIDELEIPNARVVEFVDNGYTGTSMERPALQEMLDMVRSGQVNCIVVKDFSRFSRNALESGYYIEQVFPLYKIRFISVSDRFDSNDYMNDTGGIDVAFKFLMHEYYSQDLSKKVKSAKRVKMARGENIVATTIYGYVKSDAGKWEPEDGTADVVRLMFRMALDGVPPAVIKDRLFEAGYPTPKEHTELKRGNDIVPKCRWETRRVKEILQNEQYIGTYISGKQDSKPIGANTRQYWTDKSEWIVKPDSHTPIINKEDFYKVQALMDSHLQGRITIVNTNETWKEDVLPLINENPLKKSQCKYPKRRRMLSGEYEGTPIYGYTRPGIGTTRGNDGSEYDPSESDEPSLPNQPSQSSNALVIDPQAAEIIRNIFELALQGHTTPEIAKRLSDAGLPMPREHMRLAKGDKIEPTCGWRAQNVRNILNNIQYTGAYVSGRILKDADSGKKYRPSKKDWIVIPDKNPPIVSKDLFDKVQAIIAEKKKSLQKNKTPRNYLLRSKVRCGCCDIAMTYDPIANPVFRCYHTASDLSAPCHKLKVVVSELDEAVLAIVRKQAEVILATTDITDLRKTSGNAQQISDCEKWQKALMGQRQAYYERFITGEIDRQTHQTLKAECSAQIERVNSQLAMYRQSAYDSQTNQKTASYAKTVLRETATEREVVDMLIEKIHVFPNNHLEITWKVSGFAAYLIETEAQ